MEVSSERRSTRGESVHSVLLAERTNPVDLQYVADEEFPSELPNTYDWMLQPASQRAAGRMLSLSRPYGSGAHNCHFPLPRLQTASILPLNVDLNVFFVALCSGG